MAKVRVLPKRAGNCGESGHLSSQCPKKKVHAVDESAATVSVSGSQETFMVGAIVSYFDLGSVSEWSLELRGENEGICSVGTASVCEGDFVDIEIDSGADVSCLPSNIGADTYPLHETRLSMCGGHHVAAGGGQLHELGARILGLETDDVRGNRICWYDFESWRSARRSCQHKISAAVDGKRSFRQAAGMHT